MSSIVNLVYELLHELPNDLRFRFLGSQELSEKSQIWMETEPSTQSPFDKLALVVAVKKKTRKNRYQFFLFLSSFTGFLHFVPNNVSRIVRHPNFLPTQNIYISLYFPKKTNLVSTQPTFFIFPHKNKYLRLEFVF